MSKQSSIEWFMAEYSCIYYEMETNEISKKEFAEKHFELVQQAKQMHKEEIIKILNKREDYLGTQPSVFDYLTNEEWFEQYYQETYGGNK